MNKSNNKSRLGVGFQLPHRSANNTKSGQLSHTSVNLTRASKMGAESSRLQPRDMIRTPGVESTRDGAHLSLHIPTGPRNRGPASQGVCANCLRKGHYLSQCIGPLDEDGFIPGCPWCNTLDHILEQCPSFDKDDKTTLAKEMLFKRQNRPPLRCTKAPWEHDIAQTGQAYHLIRPWSTDQAVQYDKAHPGYWKTYQYQKFAGDDQILEKANYIGRIRDARYPNKIQLPGQTVSRSSRRSQHDNPSRRLETPSSSRHQSRPSRNRSRSPPRGMETQYRERSRHRGSNNLERSRRHDRDLQDDRGYSEYLRDTHYSPSPRGRGNTALESTKPSRAVDEYKIVMFSDPIVKDAFLGITRSTKAVEDRLGIEIFSKSDSNLFTILIQPRLYRDEAEDSTAVHERVKQGYGLLSFWKWYVEVGEPDLGKIPTLEKTCEWFLDKNSKEVEKWLVNTHHGGLRLSRNINETPKEKAYDNQDPFISTPDIEKENSPKKPITEVFKGPAENQRLAEWQTYSSQMNNIMNSMIPDIDVALETMYYEVARCFAFPEYIESYHTYVKAGKEEWYCLLMVLAAGMEISEPAGLRRECECKGAGQSCVRVRRKSGYTLVRVIE